MKVKEIKELEVEKLSKLLTEKDREKMERLHLINDWELLDLLKDGVKESGAEDEEEFISISEYLDFIEESHEIALDDFEETMKSIIYKEMEGND